MAFADECEFFRPVGGGVSPFQNIKRLLESFNLKWTGVEIPNTWNIKRRKSLLLHDFGYGLV